MSKRPLFQIHLSTAIALLFVSGAVIGLNISFRTFRETGEGEWGPDGFMDYGWPCTALRVDAQYVRFTLRGDYDRTLQSYFDEPVEPIATAIDYRVFLVVYTNRRTWSMYGIAANLACGLLVLGAAGISCERYFLARHP